MCPSPACCSDGRCFSPCIEKMKSLIFIVLQRGHSELLHLQLHFCQRYNVQPWYNVILRFGLFCCIGRDGRFGMLLPRLGKIMPYLCERQRQNAAITLENWNVKVGLAFPATEIGFQTWIQTLTKVRDWSLYSRAQNVACNYLSRSETL